MDFLDVDSESHRLVLSQLPPKDLVSVAATCRYFYRAVYDGCFAEQLWKRLCTDLLGPGVVALHEAAVPVGCKAAAIFWHDVWRAGTNLDSVQWWNHGAQELKQNVAKVVDIETRAQRAEAEEKAARLASESRDGLGEERRAIAMAEAEAAASGATTLKSKLARSGHASILIGTRVVVTGGILRDGSKQVDIVVVNLATLQVSRPEARGDMPSTRFRHTMTPIKPSPGSLLEEQVSDALRHSHNITDGELILCFGGYNTIGEEFGANSTYVLWAAYDGSLYMWVRITTQGEAPSPRFHHSCDSYAGGKRVLVFGGEGYAQDDSGEGPSPCVYTLDVDTLTWSRRVTHAPLEEHSPGIRTLHVTTVRNSPVTGREELVVVGGYSESLLAEMKPFTLDLDTLCWRCWPGMSQGAPNRDRSAQPPQQLPAPRQRMAANRLTRDWLLISAGCPASGQFLDDLQRLHIPSLTWGTPPDVLGQPSRALRKISGHTFSGLLAFGGCIPTIMGIMPVEKMDLLLLGQSSRGIVPVHDMRSVQVAHAAVAMDEDEDVAGPGGSLPADAQALQRLPLGKQLKLKDNGSLINQDEPEEDDEGVFGELMQDQLLSKGQRINIGSPDTYFRPVYATAAGVKDVQEQQEARVKGRLQVISTSVLADPELMSRMRSQRSLHGDAPPPEDAALAPGTSKVIDEETAVAAIAGAMAAVAKAGSKQPQPGHAATVSSASRAEDHNNPAAKQTMVRFQDVVGPNPFQKVADAHSSLKRPRTSDDLAPLPDQAARPLPHPGAPGAAAPPPTSERHIPLAVPPDKRVRAAAPGEAQAYAEPQAGPSAADKGKAKAVSVDPYAASQRAQPMLTHGREGTGSSEPQHISLHGTSAHAGPSAAAASASCSDKVISSEAAAHVAPPLEHLRLGEGGTGSSSGSVKSSGPVLLNNDPENGSRTPHLMTVVRNMPCPTGPNPFASVLAPLEQSWSGGASVVLLPLDAELDPVAVERLRYGASTPLEV